MRRPRASPRSSSQLAWDRSEADAAVVAPSACARASASAWLRRRVERRAGTPAGRRGRGRRSARARSSRRCCGRPRVATKTLPSGSATSSWRSAAARRRALAGAAASRSTRRPREPLAPLRVTERRREHGAVAVEQHGRLDLRRDLGQVGEGGHGVHLLTILRAVRRPLAQPLAKFFADRGTHLAAMIAYFGLLSSVSLIFLALAVLGCTGRAEESSYLVEALQHLFPSQPIDNIVSVVEEIRENATALGVIGACFLLWTSLSLFSVLESAFNIVYGRPNRPFLRGKSLATLFMAGSIVVLFDRPRARLRSATTCCSASPGRGRERRRRVRALGRALDARRLRLPRARLRAADERRP